MEILEQFGINPLLLAAQVVNFLVLLFILKRFLYKPILNVLEQRRLTIEDSLKNAENIEKKLAETNEKMDQMIIKAASDAQKIHDESKKEASLIIEEARQRSVKVAEDLIKKGEELLLVEREKMRMELRMELADLVVAALQKVTGKVLNKQDQKDLVTKAVREIS